MKKLTVLIACTLFCINAFAQQSAEEKQIQAPVIKFFDALALINNAGMKAEVTNDFTLVEHGLIWNLDSLVNAIAPMKNMNVKRTNTINFVKTEQTGNTAIVIYYNTADMTMGDKKRTVKWLESAVLAKEGGKWKIKLLHSTDLK